MHQSPTVSPYQLSINELLNMPYRATQELVEKFQKIGFQFPEGTYVVGNHHLLFSTIRLAQALITLGIAPQNIHLIGKCYSTSQDVVNELRAMGANITDTEAPPLGQFAVHQKKCVNVFWQDVQAKMVLSPPTGVIMFDDGHQSIEQLPKALLQYPIIGAEVTINGVYSPVYAKQINMVELARSAAKTKFDGPTVLQSSLDGIHHSLGNFELLGKTVGIIGVGNIGKCVKEFCLNKGATVHTYDVKTTDDGEKLDAVALLPLCDIIIGTTGQDVFSENNTIVPIQDLNFKPGQLFLSFSSKDVEFNSLLKAMTNFKTDENNILAGDINSVNVSIAKRGFPLNFDGTPTNMPITLDQRYAAVYLVSMIQCAMILRAGMTKSMIKNPQSYQLSPIFQQTALHSALPGMIESDIFSEKKLENATDLDYLSTTSEGASLNEFNGHFILTAEKELSKLLNQPTTIETEALAQTIAS